MRNGVRIVLLILGIALAAVCLALFHLKTRTEYQGKSVQRWFEDADAITGTLGYQSSMPYQAFIEMEGDAVPFLTQCLKAQPSVFQKAYAKLLKWLPVKAAGKLPQPTDSFYYLRRRNCALQLLGFIGSTQRFKRAQGEPTAKPSIALAVPPIRALLHDTNCDPRAAAGAVMFIGPEAASTIPDLMRLASEPDGSAASSAIQAFGIMGASASNAVPLLIEIAASPEHKHRHLAVQSLGQMGPVSRPAVPTLVSLLSGPDGRLREMALRALADTGFTPDDAVPALQLIQHGTNDWSATLANLALWNRDKQRPALRAEISAVLRDIAIGKKPAWLLFDLATLGTNATTFVPELKEIMEHHSDTFVRGRAKAALGQIQ